jgi:hypothetical protein
MSDESRHFEVMWRIQRIALLTIEEGRKFIRLVAVAGRTSHGEKINERKSRSSSYDLYASIPLIKLLK